MEMTRDIVERSVDPRLNRPYPHPSRSVTVGPQAGPVWRVGRTESFSCLAGGGGRPSVLSWLWQFQWRAFGRRLLIQTFPNVMPFVLDSGSSSRRK
jgi:hypothetical protein